MKEALWKPSGQGGDLVPVHGGLAEPVDRVVPLSERAKLLREAESLPSLRVTRAELSTVHRIADGRLASDEATLAPVDSHNGALQHLLELCQERGIKRAVPEAFDELFRAAIKAGNGQDDFAVLSKFTR